MDDAVFIVIAIGSLVVLALLAVVVWRRGGEQRMTPLSGVAAACVVCGIVFGEDRAVGYSFFAVGIILAVVDSVRRWRGSGSSGSAAGR